MQWSKLNSKKSGTWSEKMTNSEDLTRKVLNLARQGVMPNSERNWRHGPTCRRGETSRKQGNRRRAKEAAGWAWMGLGRLAQAGRPSPVQGLVMLPFALAAIRAFYSPLTESHAWYNSSSATEEQRREGHHLEEERVELVDLGFPSRRGNLARKTTSEFPELEARSRKDPSGDLVYVSLL
jgi:hypothetical protein